MVERIVRGGYPVVQKRTSRRRQDWYANYVETLIQRDVRDMARVGSLAALPKLLTLAASQTARLANLSELATGFELSRPTIHNYLTLIERLFLVEFLPPWFSYRVKRLIKTPKLHFGDTGLACSLLRCCAAELEASSANATSAASSAYARSWARDSTRESFCTTAITCCPSGIACSRCL